MHSPPHSVNVALSSLHITRPDMGLLLLFEATMMMAAKVAYFHIGDVVLSILADLEVRQHLLA